MTAKESDSVARAEVKDAMRVASDAARRHLRHLERLVGTASDLEAPFSARLRRRLARVVPGGRRRALVRLVAGFRAVVEATERAADWQDAQATYAQALAERAARGAPARSWEGPRERPALLVGTGGGGTRLLADLAARLGLFLGPRVNESFDSVALAPLVYELVEERGDAVDLPEGDGARARILSTLEAVYGDWLREGEPFGWKLPESILVLPLLLDAFPDARVVFLVRHPVTASLRRPHVTTLPEHPLGRAVLAGAYRAVGRPPGRVPTDPPYVRHALVWRHEVGRAHRWLARSVPAERVLRLRYEELALSPRRCAERLAGHLGLSPPGPGDASGFDVRRIQAPGDRARVREVLAICGDVAAEVGYADGWLDGPWERPERRDLFAIPSGRASGTSGPGRRPAPT